MKFYAHSVPERDKRDWQGLIEHLVAVANLAARFAAPFGMSKAAFAAGMLHDLGKYDPRFQARLSGSTESVDHSTAGAAEILNSTSAAERHFAELIAYVIAGHHAGLPDRKGEQSSLDERMAGFSAKVLDAAWQAEVLPHLSDINPDQPFGFTKSNPDRVKFQLAFLGRMLFSCLVDADFKDTEAFYANLGEIAPDRHWPALQDVLPAMVAAFDHSMNAKRSDDNDLNRLRSKVLDHVRGQAGRKPGFFTLTVPTGGGKTLGSLGFALDHARRHDMRRIIYAIPFTSIIDQTAAIFRDVLGEQHVLEHHSAIETENTPRGQDREGRDKLKLAMEDWAAPVIVTTNVQLFESLFAARTSRCRKLHNIANSVIILDEAQTLPRHLLKPAMEALRELTVNYGCSIVLCTATQPALGEARLKGGLPLAGRELAPDIEDLFKTLRRTEIHRTGAMSNDDLVEALRSTQQALVIVNSRKHALELFRHAEAEGLPGLIHLTTRQCAAHRREILKDIRQRLKSGSPCRVIATSLVEAGVDIDFPRVWRAEAGLDSIIQAAGRCNREGKRPVEDSIVTVFAAPDYPPPQEIKGLVADTVRMLGRHDDLQSLPAIEDYFGEVYWRVGPGGLDRKNILDSFRISSGGSDFAYRTVAREFLMIESTMVPVVIERDEVAKKAVDDLRNEVIPSGLLARRLQLYVVQVPLPARQRLMDPKAGHVQFVRPDIRGDQFAVLMSGNLYQEDIGLIWDDDADYMAYDGMLIC